METTSSVPVVKTPPMAHANALIGAALNAPLRGRFLFLMRLAWWALVVVTVGMFVLTIPTRWSQLVIEGNSNFIALQELGLHENFIAFLLGTFDGITFLAYTFVGALIFSRKSQEWIGLFASLTLITAVFAIVRPFDALLFVDNWLRVPLLLILALAAITVIVFIYIFPDGHFAPRWTRWIVLGLCAFALYGLLDRVWLTQPFRWPPAPLSPVIFLGIFFGALVQIYRYRRVSDSVQREQMRWVVFSVALGALGLLEFYVILPALLPRVLLPGMTRVLYLVIAAPLCYLALLQLPIALAFSIFRYHLWDIDLIISRALIYALLTAILAGLFAALESLMQNVFVLLTGQQSDVATVIATLIVVAAFTPLKERIQKFVEARFQDASDPAAKLKTFAELVETRVSPLYAPQIARRLLAESVTAFDAKGGAAYTEQNGELKLIQTLGVWDGNAACSIPLQRDANAPRFGMLALADRKNGAAYTEHDLQAITELARSIARALEEDAVA